MTTENTSKKILVVDDDPVMTSLVETRLFKNGYIALTTNEAADGLQIAMSNDISLIILDVMMPIINGYNFCRLLKADPKKKMIPVVFLTSRDKEEDREFGKEMGAEAYLTKPVDIDKLLETIHTLINGDNKE